jgi:serine O-acetyltransferase
MSPQNKVISLDLGLPRGDRNQNPEGISFRELIAEDFATHQRDPFSPGFWAIAVHRFGNWRMGVKRKALRAPLTLLHRAAEKAVIAQWGIDLPYIVKLGRRVRIEHHGCLVMGAREIGDDVVFRHSVTLGVRHRGGLAFPTIGSRVEIGPGACIVGGVRIGDDCYIGANTVIVHNMRPGTALLGIPPVPVRFNKPTVAEPPREVAPQRPLETSAI